LDAPAPRCILRGVAGADDRSGGNEDDAVLRAFKAGVVARIKPEDVQTHLDLGRAYADMGRLEDAALEFELVLEVEPYHPVAQAELMAVRMRKSSQ
jgi:Flp pilus assembly protein TadD